ncbi:MAG: OmpA family protein [Deltaproteobacteria bacterium]|nr:OmpA family protein [Deltaproteobacteria bacterium]
MKRQPTMWQVLGTVGVFAGLASACGATLPPKELSDARAAYSRIEKGQVNKINPAQVHEAKLLLDAAEAAFEKDPKARTTIDKAYLALRKAELAEAHAGEMKAEKEITEAEIALGRKTKAELDATRQQLNAAEHKVALSEQQLAQERQARAEAEKRAKEALDNLAKIASVKQETRGTIITLSGSVLFASNKSTLLPGAMAGLDNVVTALKSTPGREVIVEGHTDSQGSHGLNMDLSQARAESVRSYLVDHGIPPDQVKARGLGPDRPIADNKTAEGRANNRRVEIIVAPAPEPK